MKYRKRKRFNDTDSYINYTHPSVKYTFVKKIGDGSASKIFKCVETKTNIPYVIKRIHKTEEWKAELNILKLLKDAKKLLKFQDFYISDRFVYIVTKFYEGYDLFEHIDINVPFTEEYTKSLVKEMAICIKECHDLGIAHLDIKCENYMVEDMNKPTLILIDFGHAEKISNPRELKLGHSKYGTCFYLCPEGYSNYYSMKSDTWSLGICIYLFLTGDYPFNGDDKEYEHNVKRGNLILEDLHKHKISDEAIELLQGCLEPNPSNRYTINQVLDSRFLTKV